MTLYPFFEDFLDVIEYFEKLLKENNKNSDFIEFEINDFIEKRNVLLKIYNKSESIINYYYNSCKEIGYTIKTQKNQINNSSIKKQKKIKNFYQKKRIKKKFKRRYKTISVYNDFLEIIRCFDKKTKGFYNKNRSSCKKIKTIRKEYKNKIIKFKVDKFKIQIRNMRSILKRLEDHINFLLNIFPTIKPNFENILYIKNYIFKKKKIIKIIYNNNNKNKGKFLND
jgi:hypothetical protein